MSNLLLYSHVTPNSNDIHYIFDDMTDYKTELSSHLVATVTMNNYRINNGVIKVSTNTSASFIPTVYKTVTYAINEIDNTCYVVRSSELQGGFVVYYCDIDYWATFIFDAHFKHINVLRCNRNIDIGIYDDIKATNTSTQSKFEIPSGEYVIDTTTTPYTHYSEDYKFANVYIVFCLTFNVEQTAFGSTSATQMFAIPLSDIYTIYNQQATHDSMQNPLMIARAIIGGIYGVVATNKYGASTTNDAKVTKAYILPKDLIFVSYPVLQPVISVKSKSMYGNFNSLTAYEVSNSYSYNKQFTITLDPNYNYYVGSINKGLKLVRETADTVVKYQSIVNNNDIQVIVKQGDNQQDITSEFEIDLTMNDGDVTNLSAIKQALKTGLNVVQGVTSGNYFGLGMNLASNVTNLIGNHYYGKQTGNGDGIVTFYKPSKRTRTCVPIRHDDVSERHERKRKRASERRVF